MTLEITLDIAEPDWRRALPEIDTLSRDTVMATLAMAAPDLAKGNAEIGLVFTNDDAIRILNRDWRGKDKPTNVLSFPLLAKPAAVKDIPVLLGDIVLSLETITLESRRDDKSLADHARHMIVHGVLHLVGYDHEQDKEAEAMESLETEILSGIDVANPYIILT